MLYHKSSMRGVTWDDLSVDPIWPDMKSIDPENRTSGNKEFNKCINMKRDFCLAKDHWRGFSTRNAHMVHIVNYIRIKMVYTDK